VSWVGREVLIKTVAQAIPTCAMSVFKFPVGLCQTIRTTINRFWWGHNLEDKKIHWINGRALCRRKDEGRLRFREMEAFNMTLLAKQP